MRPAATTRRGDLASVELPRDCIVAGVTGGLDLPDDWQHVGPKPLTPGLRRRKRRLGASFTLFTFFRAQATQIENRFGLL